MVNKVFCGVGVGVKCGWVFCKKVNDGVNTKFIQSFNDRNGSFGIKQGEDVLKCSSTCASGVGLLGLCHGQVKLGSNGGK